MPDPRPGEEERIRALLADARSDETMPSDVTARLDGVLSRLIAERGGTDSGSGTTVVVPLRDRERRRRVLGGLVAAAAIAVIGGGVAVLNLDHGTQVQSAGSAAGDSAQSASSSSAKAPGGGRVLIPSPLSSPFRPAGPGDSHQDSLTRLADTVPALSAASFDRQVRILLGMADTGAAALPVSPLSEDLADGRYSAGKPGSCVTPPVAIGSKVGEVRQILLDGAPATLVVTPSSAHPRTATAYSCDGATALARTTLAR